MENVSAFSTYSYVFHIHKKKSAWVPFRCTIQSAPFLSSSLNLANVRIASARLLIIRSTHFLYYQAFRIRESKPAGKAVANLVRDCTLVSIFILHSVDLHTFRAEHFHIVIISSVVAIAYITKTRYLSVLKENLIKLLLIAIYLNLFTRSKMSTVIPLFFLIESQVSKKISISFYVDFIPYWKRLPHCHAEAFLSR